MPSAQDKAASSFDLTPSPSLDHNFRIISLGGRRLLGSMDQTEVAGPLFITFVLCEHEGITANQPYLELSKAIWDTPELELRTRLSYSKVRSYSPLVLADFLVLADSSMYRTEPSTEMNTIAKLLAGTSKAARLSTQT